MATSKEFPASEHVAEWSNGGSLPVPIESVSLPTTKPLKSDYDGWFIRYFQDLPQRPTQEVRDILGRASQITARDGKEYVEREHLVAAVLSFSDETFVGKVINAANIRGLFHSTEHNTHSRKKRKKVVLQPSKAVQKIMGDAAVGLINDDKVNKDDKKAKRTILDSGDLLLALCVSLSHGKNGTKMLDAVWHIEDAIAVVRDSESDKLAVFLTEKTSAKEVPIFPNVLK